MNGTSKRRAEVTAVEHFLWRNIIAFPSTRCIVSWSRLPENHHTKQPACDQTSRLRDARKIILLSSVSLGLPSCPTSQIHQMRTDKIHRIHLHNRHHHCRYHLGDFLQNASPAAAGGNHVMQMKLIRTCNQNINYNYLLQLFRWRT